MSDLFNRGISSLTVHGQTDEAQSSWWLDLPREGFTAIAERDHLDRMRRSELARKIGVMTIGWGPRISGRRDA